MIYIIKQIVKSITPYGILALYRRLNTKKRTHEYLGIKKPDYYYCVHQGALLAKRLGYDRISVIEFGVAGGNGLIALENYTDKISKETDVKIDIYGFDMAIGLPPPVDYRDLPYHWKEGFFKMDIENLQKKLHSAKLVIGDIRELSEQFFEKYKPAPIAAVIHDMDFYSSTVGALKLFNGDQKYFLPRIFNYFDDIIGTEIELYNDFTGERLAIKEFNDSHSQKKISPAYHLICQKNVETWYHKIFILHFFNHARYNDFVSEEDQQIPLI